MQKENNKRVCARGITFINNDVLMIERHRLMNDNMLYYYSIPGGGVENNETTEEASIRETLEETTVKTNVIKYLGREEYDQGVVYWYLLKYISGKPSLGGEELLRNNQNNYYEVKLIPYNNLDKINILGKGREMIIKGYNYFQGKIDE